MITWCGSLDIRHNDPKLVDRVERALRANHLPNDFIPEPTTFEGALWGINSGQERLRYEWREAHWGCWAMTTSSTRIDSGTVRAEFEAASYPPTKLFQRMIDLGYSIDGTWVDDTSMFAERCDNGIISEDPDGDTVFNWDAQAYLEECALRGDTPVLDERGRPDRAAVCAYFDALRPNPSHNAAAEPEAVPSDGGLSYFQRLAAAQHPVRHTD